MSAPINDAHPPRRECRLRGLIAFASALAFLSPLPAAAAPVSVDFDSFTRGTVVTNQIPQIAFTLLGGAPVAGPVTYALLDGPVAGTGNPVNVFGAEGMAITPSATTADLPSLASTYFDLSISFTQAVDYFSITVLDAEESVTAQAFLGASVVQSLSKTLVGDRTDSPFHGQVYRLDAGAIGGALLFDRIVIDLTDGGPELYDNVVFNIATIDEPAGVIGLVLGLIALARIRNGRDFRRRRPRPLTPLDLGRPGSPTGRAGVCSVVRPGRSRRP